ncbi:MAG TPA: helix-turn-helix transcriptional regulator [Acidimicrobiales bacterium]|nr:helix-turn-helix transcriptional regulator [Acidimicrobiales bacterium]
MVQSVRGELEDRFVELGKFIQDQRRRTHLSVRRLADLSGISNPYLSQIERGLRKPSAEILQQLAKALSISAETLYVRAGVLDASTQPPSGVVEAIRADLDLSEDQKSSLVQIYESFRLSGPTAAAPVAPSDAPRPAAKPTVTRNRRPANKVD